MKDVSEQRNFSKEYIDLQKQMAEEREKNKILLTKFEEYLNTKSISPKTIKKHISNIDFYANQFLLYYDVIELEKGFLEIGSFLGDFFIRKTCWASKTSILENITSLKKFYVYLNELGKVSKNELDEMNELIKSEKKYWIDEVENY